MADEEQQLGLISEFISITGVDAERSRYYLEDAAWDLQVVQRVF
jgi:hypothetical protein